MLVVTDYVPNTGLTYSYSATPSFYPLNGLSVYNPFEYLADRVPEIEDVIFNDPATIILWGDGTKTVVKCMKGEKFNKETGFAMAYLKKLFGKDYKRVFKDWCSDDED